MSIFGESEAERMKRREEEQREFAREQMATQEGLQQEQVQLQQQQRKRDLTRWQQDLDDELVVLRHQLRSERFDEDKGWVSKEEMHVNEDGKKEYRPVPPLLNETGIQLIENTVRPLISRNIINSNFDEQRILKMLRSTLHNLISTLGNNYDQYEIYGYKKEVIQDPTDTLDTVINIIKNFIIPGPYRALNDGERKHIRTMRKESSVQTVSDTNKEKNKGLFGLGS